MDKLANLISFAKVVECGNISAAARLLNLTQPAVSQHLRNLEKELGVRLLNRTTRSLTLTEAGEIYYNQIGNILEKLSDADRSVQEIDQCMCGILRIGAPVGFGQEVFASFFSNFKKQYPGLILDLDLRDQYVDVINSRLDAAIRLGPITDADLIVRKLGVSQRRLAATKNYLEKKGRPQKPEDLIDHDYLLFSRLLSGDKVSLIHKDGQKSQTQINPSMRVNNAAFLRQMMLADLGIGLAHMWILNPLVEQGILEYVLPEWTYEPQDIHIVYPSNRYIPTKVRRFVEALSEHFQTLGVFS